MQKSAQLIDYLAAGVTDSAGVVVSGGSAYIYAYGTTTPISVYFDRSLTTPATNPVILDAAARAQVYTNQDTRVVIFDANGNQINDVSLAATGSVQSILSSDVSLAVSGSGQSFSGQTVEDALTKALGSFGSTDFAYKYSSTSTARSIQGRLQEHLSVKDFGAVGDGVTNDTAAIQACLDAAAGKIVYFPHGTYLVDHAGTAYSPVTYALNVQVADVVIQGEGSGSIVKLAAHEQECAIFEFNKASGKCAIRDLRIDSVARVNTTHTGPMAIDFGDFGNTTGTGTLDELIIENLNVNNVSFFVHGEGCKYLRIRNNRVVIMGGGLYPTYFSECINVAATAGETYQLTNLEISHNIISHDGTYDDHAVYTLGPIKKIVIENNIHITPPTNGLYKVDFGTGTPTIESVRINGNRSATGTSSEAFITFSGSSTINTASVVNNISDSWGLFINSEAAFQSLSIVNNTHQNSKTNALLLVKNSALSVMGTVLVEGNNFDNYNKSDNGQIGLKVTCAKTVVLTDNVFNPFGVNAGVPLDIENHDACFMAANTCSKTPSHVSGTATHITDIGNSWSAPVWFSTSQPASAAHLQGEIVFNATPAAGDPMGWRCVVAGTPGTWEAMPAAGGKQQFKRIATTPTTLASAATINSVDTSNTSCIILTGVTATRLNGLGDNTNSWDGQILIVVNQTGQNLTIGYQDAGASSSNQIWTSTGADVAKTGNSVAMFVRDASVLGRWILLGHWDAG